jgi:polygalacturonase
MTENYFNLIDAGAASGNRASLNREALQRLIDGVAAAGGGTVAIPPGIYAINGTVWLHPSVDSSITIRGCEGATLLQTAGAEIPLFGIGSEDDESGHVVMANLQIQAQATQAQRESRLPSAESKE